jgi:hypothetical protein
MSENKKPMCVRDMQPGQTFRLVRTGDLYTLIRRETGTPSGTRYVVMRQGFARLTSLHHSCRVVLRTEGGAG